MQFVPDNPLIVQSDRTLLLETMGPHFAAARDELARFAELVKSPEYMHTYRLNSLSLWNAAAAGMDADAVVGALERWAKYPVPPGVPVHVRETMGRFGKLVLERGDDGHLVLRAANRVLMKELRGLRKVKPLLGRVLDPERCQIHTADRGEVKRALIQAGHPVRDQAGFVDGAPLAVALAQPSGSGQDWEPRAYQNDAIDAFLAGPDGEGGSGVVVLPCGAGKTIVGILALVRMGMKTLILCTNTTALRQWRDEILARTSLEPDEVGEYSGNRKDLAPVTLTTYQMLTWRPSKTADFVHFGIFDRDDWGLIIYDEVHLLPAPVFRSVARIQARRRLGLTATLIREDGLEKDVFALIGPKRFDVPWKDLERQGWIATARCVELRVPLPASDRLAYATAEERDRYRLASTNRSKNGVVERIIEEHRDGRLLVIGMYLAQLEALAKASDAPLITGDTPQSQRDALFQAFRDGSHRVLVLSKVGNFSVDLPDATVCIQVSGTWGSRQEEAQRLGRVLRPKSDGATAWFYTVVTKDSVEQDFAERRQLFLAEQGYSYEIRVVDDTGTDP